MNVTHPALEVRGLGKSYGPAEILHDVSFSAADGEFVCLVGPSGAGKTTLLRCISQLLNPDSGEVLLAGQAVTEPPSDMAVVFQDYSRSLLPWMRVQGNIDLPLRRLGLPRAERRARIAEALEIVGLAGSERLYPWQMSGGMQQRVAIARALAYKPSVLIMDEPFASVDAQTRADLEDLVLDLRHTFGVTIVLVTHDIDEAVYLSDKVVVLSGRPASVTETVEVRLPAPREQIATKAEPKFLALRARIHALIAAAGRPSVVNTD